MPNHRFQISYFDTKNSNHFRKSGTSNANTFTFDNKEHHLRFDQSTPQFFFTQTEVLVVAQRIVMNRREETDWRLATELYWL
jgi:hypothetical protein